MRSSAGSQYLVLILALIFSESVGAIVNIESIRLKPKKSEFMANLGLKFDKKEGNTNKEEIALSGELRIDKEDVEHLALVSGSYGENQGIKNTNKYLAHYRYVFMKLDLTSVELFAQVERDEFTRLSFRGLFGAGFRLQLFDTSGLLIYTGLGPFYSQEKLENSDPLTESEEESFWRMNSYLTLKINLDQNIDFLSVTYFQPVFDSLVDYRLLNQNELDFNINERFSIMIYFQQSHDNLPPAGVKKTDQQWGTVLKYDL